jgi:hypothetical protein
MSLVPLGYTFTKVNVAGHGAGHGAGENDHVTCQDRKLSDLPLQ